MSLTIFLPGIVAVLYFITAVLHLFKREYPHALIWFSYSIANIGIVIIGNK